MEFVSKENSYRARAQAREAVAQFCGVDIPVCRDCVRVVFESLRRHGVRAERNVYPTRAGVDVPGPHLQSARLGIGIGHGRQSQNPAWPDCDHDSDSDSLFRIDGPWDDRAAWPAESARARMAETSAGRIRHRYRYRYRNPNRFRNPKHRWRAWGGQECLPHQSGCSRA
jgi:hypothetical protein